MKKVGKVKIAIQDICTGPIHYNFKIQSFTDTGRLLFDIKVTQISKVVLFLTGLKVHLDKPMNSRFYTYSGNFLNGQQQIESGMSTVFENDFKVLQVIEEINEENNLSDSSDSLLFS